MISRRAVAAAVLAFAASTSLAADPELFGPYTTLNDSPFTPIAGYSYFHLEHFEGVFRPPGYAATTGGVILGPSGFTDSVDSDIDGVNGIGTAGSSWFSNGSTNVFTFTFDAAVLGRLPTHAGIVWTDVGDTTAGPSGRSAVLFKAFGPGASDPLSEIGPVALGDFLATGDTGEDRFFGAINQAGISRIEISMPASVDWEVDHLQYGALAPIPEPEQWLLMALGLGALGLRLRKRNPV